MVEVITGRSFPWDIRKIWITFAEIQTAVVEGFTPHLPKKCNNNNLPQDTHKVEEQQSATRW